MSVVINPSSGGSGATTPTSTQSNLTIIDYTQMLFRQHIIVGSRLVIIGADASLVGI